MYKPHIDGIVNNSNKYKNIVFFQKSLLVETYIIGYKTEGETILFFIRADGGVSFSGLVDCYRSKDIDIVSSVLRESGVKKLNFICWTHPDLDHSKGLKEMIKQYSSSETNIWIPEGVDAKEISCSEEVKNLFAYLFPS